MSHKKLNEEQSDFERQGSPDPFQVDKTFLSSLFKRSEIDEGNSSNNIKSMGLIPGLASKLKTDMKRGLNTADSNDFQMRAQAFGRNVPLPVQQKSIWELIKEPFEDLMLKIIFGSGIVDIIIGIVEEEDSEWIDGVSIMVAVFFIVLITAGNNYMQQKQFEKLYKEAEVYTLQVIRDSETAFIQNTELMVGDILKFGIGDILPVDGLMVSGSEVRVDESNITGETKEINKTVPTAYDNGNPFLISGSKIIDGDGTMLVCAVGESTQLGELKKSLQEESSPTPLQLKLEGLSNSIAKIALTASAATVTVLLLHLAYDVYNGDKCLNCNDFINTLIDYLVIGVTIIVVAVPEGLPLAVTLSLAYSVNKMRDENNWVRFLQACETMGGVDNICTDKTGTLTTNSMKVESLYFEEILYDKAGVDRRKYPNPKSVELLCQSVCVNSSMERQALPNGQTQLVGNKTETALIEFADALGFMFEKVRNKDNITRTVAFSSKRKKMIVVYKLSNNQYRVFVKGASEKILEKATSLYNKSGGTTPLNQNLKDKIMRDTIEVFAADALRTITVAYKDVYGQDPSNQSEDLLEKDLTVLAIFGIRDPLRAEIPLALEKCRRAGITVRMVTGDNSQTAVSIAKKAGILPETYQLSDDSYVVMEGSKFTKEIGGLISIEDPDDPDNQDPAKPKKMIKKVNNDLKFKEIVKELRVMSRSAPEDKYNLVTGLKELGSVVAVTGDGTNDAPALKKANIGFAMNTGSAIAKEAAGIVLMDDNFNSIVLACKWGRNIFDSIRKFVQFQMTINVVALVLTFMGSAILSTSPLNAVQMLWINLIMDTFAALALATEPPTEELLERRPHGLKEDIISPVMKRFIVGHSLYQLTVLFIILFLGPDLFDIPDSSDYSTYDEAGFQHFTIFFHTFVLMQVFNAINSRKLNTKDRNVFKNFCNNPLFFIIILFIFFAQILIVEVGGSFIETSSLTLTQHLICLALGAGSLLIGYLLKLIPEEVFSKIKFFKETDVNTRNMDRGMTSKLRRGASNRFSSKSHSSIMAT